MDKKDLLLSIDNGTQSVKALVFDAWGNLVAKEKVEFTPYFSQEPGWAEQDPEVFWDSLCQACQAVWNKHGVAPSRIAGVALTTQRGTVVNVDRDGKPLRPSILWLDQRKTYDQPPLKEPLASIFKVVGAADTIDYLRTQAESNWIVRNQPEIWAKTYKYLLLSGFLTLRLTGEFADSVGCQVGYVPFDYKGLQWYGKRDFRYGLLNITPDKLPKLVPQTQPIGTISPEASEKTGIPAGLPLIAAAADKACEVLGSGALTPDTGCISYGTTATINVNHKKFITVFPFMPSYPSGVPGNHNIEVQIFRGYWMVSWFKKEFGLEERLEASEKGTEPEILFEKLVSEIPAGSMGLMLQPYWTPGVKHPGPEGKGAIVGFGDVHTRAHLYRSILEGLAYALREGKERIEKRTKTRISRLIVSGGGSQSDSAMQITADVFNLAAARPHLYETSGLGAAMDLAVGLGIHKNFGEAIKAMTRVSDTFSPNPANARLYNELYREVYEKLYDRLRPIYHKIRQITGYPR